MIESVQKNVDLQVVFRDQVTTEIGIVVKSEVVFNGVPQTFFFIDGLTGSRFVGTLMAIEDAEKSAVDPNVLRYIEYEGVTLEEYLETGSNELIEMFKKGSYTFTAPNLLEPLMRQIALKKLYGMAKGSQDI